MKDKKIVRLGNSAGIIVDKYMLHDTGFEIGDYYECKCSKGKIIITKKGE